MMGYFTEKAKNALKKGSDNEIGNIKFKVLDSKKIGGSTQITVEVADNEGRGISIVDFWGPNKRKECTVMIKKTKDHEERYVKILAKQIIQPILDCLISGRGLEKLFKEQKKNTSERKHSCDICLKSFSSKRYLKVHVRRFTQLLKQNVNIVSLQIMTK